MILFIGTSLIYVSFFLWCRYHWDRIVSPPFKSSGADSLRVTVLIPIRNEEENISNLLADLERQTYPTSDFEVIVINDDSTDRSAEIVMEWQGRLSYDCRILNLKNSEKTGKKQALTLGVHNANGEIILATDGDCRLDNDWISSHASLFSYKAIQLVSGPVRMKAGNWFQALQALEFSGLIGIGAATLRSENPTMCNGANLGYRKSAFLDVNGYEGNDHIATGDDEFLLQKIFKAFPKGVCFLKEESCLVSTPAKKNISELINQRIRWSSKWKFHKSAFIRLGAIIVFLNYLSVYLAIALTVVNNEWLSILLSTILFRWAALSLFLSRTAKFSKITVNPLMTLVLEIIYPLLVLFLGIASIFGQYTWKGRSYQ